MLAAMEKNTGGRPTETSNSVLPVSGTSLDDLGIGFSEPPQKNPDAIGTA